MKLFPIVLCGVLLASAALAQQAPPPPGGPEAHEGMTSPGMGDWRGPRGPRGEHPPMPPSRGAAMRIERGPDGRITLGLKCADSDSTKDCAEVASQLLAKLTADSKH